MVFFLIIWLIIHIILVFINKIELIYFAEYINIFLSFYFLLDSNKKSEIKKIWLILLFLNFIIYICLYSIEINKYDIKYLILREDFGDYIFILFFIFILLFILFIFPLILNYFFKEEKKVEINKKEKKQDLYTYCIGLFISIVFLVIILIHNKISNPFSLLLTILNLIIILKFIYYKNKEKEKIQKIIKMYKSFFVIYLVVLIMLYFINEINVVLFSPIFNIFILVLIFIYYFTDKQMIIYTTISLILFLNIDIYNKLQVKVIENNLINELNWYKDIYKEDIEHSDIDKDVIEPLKMIIENEDYSYLKLFFENYTKEIKIDKKCICENEKKLNKKIKKIFYKLLLLKYKDYPSLSDIEINDRKEKYKLENSNISFKYL